MEDLVVIINEEAEGLKALGNEAFKREEYNTAKEHFDCAILLDPKNHKYYTNRSLCHAFLEDWVKSAQDAQVAINLFPKHEKAHFRLGKALIELKRFKDARLVIINAFRECGETKDLKLLEDTIFSLTDIALRPQSTDFEIVDELGDGNFSKVYKAKHRKTQKTYAVKAIERATVDRMKRRHGNINNEILMEKRALNKLDHEGVVTLYCTFQDYGTLYYQMEFVEGRDLWSLMQESKDSTPCQIGCHWTQARFFFAEALSALEHMHRRGIVHRDVKPENMMITSAGHLKFVDFGTAKDLFQTDLNGPEFVGTAEYMAPSTVNNKAGGVEVDLWALGVVLFQMLLGYTAFSAASPYLIFLRIKRAQLRIPGWVPTHISELLGLLLCRDGRQRLANATGNTTDYNSEPSELRRISYDAIRAHRFFSEWAQLRSPSDVEAVEQLGAQLPPHLTATCVRCETSEDFLSSVEAAKSVFQRDAVVDAPLHEQYLRCLGQACLELAEATADNGGVRPDVEWMQAFDLSTISSLDRCLVAHYLNRRGRLHSPGVFRLFFPSLVDARALRADPFSREYVGFSRQLQGHWNKDFFFGHIGSPEVATRESTSATRLTAAIAAINKLRPRFVVVSGNMTVVQCENAQHAAQLSDFRKCMTRLSDTIPVLYVPGPRDVKEVPTPVSLREYRTSLGADYYGAWYGGLRCLVLNSSLMINPANAPEQAAEQDVWFTEEIEQAKLCSTSIIIFAYHPWFHESLEEEDTFSAENERTNFPVELRVKWLKKLRHHKVQLVFSSLCRESEVTNVPDEQKASTRRKKLKPFSVKRFSKKDKKLDEGEVDASSVPSTDEPMRPSQVIAAALSTGELSHHDVHTHPVSLESVQLVLPDETMPEKEGGGGVVEAATSVGELGASSDSEAEEQEESHGDDPDKEDFANEEEDYEGPELVPPLPLTALRTTTVTSEGLRFVLVQENSMNYKSYDISSIPASSSELLQQFA